jgi:signal transduction histidine kinase
MRVLLINHNKEDIVLIEKALKRTGRESIHLEYAGGLASGLKRLKHEGIDVVLLDLFLPDSEGLDTFVTIHKQAPKVPIVVLTGAADDSLAVRALQMGAQDYLIKGQVDGRMLPRVMRYAVERKRLESMKDEFVSTVSHEIRTPLSIIREGASQIYDGLAGEPSEQQKRILSMILKNADRLGGIIQQLLDISKIDAQRMTFSPELVDLVALAGEAAANFSDWAEDKGLEIRQSLPDDVLWVYADKNQIFQVFVNLISNAIKFTDRGFVEIAVMEREAVAECRVTDTGGGIGKENLPKVFGKFQQFNRSDGGGEKGTGLGLAICKGIMELHHGNIWVKSELGSGSTFAFTLPLQTASEIFREHLATNVKQARADKTATLSVITFALQGFESLRREVGKEGAAEIMHQLGQIVKKNLRRQGDTLIQDTQALRIILPATRKQDARAVADRIRDTLEAYLLKIRWSGRVSLECKIAGFPEDGTTEDALLEKVGIP